MSIIKRIDKPGIYTLDSSDIGAFVLATVADVIFQLPPGADGFWCNIGGADATKLVPRADEAISDAASQAGAVGQSWILGTGWGSDPLFLVTPLLWDGERWQLVGDDSGWWSPV